MEAQVSKVMNSEKQIKIRKRKNKWYGDGEDTTKDTGHAGGRISLHSGGSNRRHDSTAFITNAGELSVGKLHSCVSETAGTF